MEGIESIVKGFKKASNIIRMNNPDYIIAPIAGAVPFVDILKIVDRKFPLDKVKYLPNSSRFYGRDEMIAEWYKKFYNQNEIGEKMKILCLDEVISGSSAVNSYLNFRKSIKSRAIENAKGLKNELEAREYYEKRLGKKIDYKIIGIAERNPSFKNIVNRKIVYVIEFDKVFTIDNIDLNPIRFKEKGINGNGRMTYLPEIKEFVVTPEYLSFLQNIASYVGADPSNVNPILNLSKIEEGIRQAID